MATTTGKHNLNLVFVAENHSVLYATIENSIRSIKEIKRMGVSVGDSPAYPEFVDLKVGDSLEIVPVGETAPIATCMGMNVLDAQPWGIS